MKVKWLCRRENNANHEKDHSGIHRRRIQCLPLSSLSGSIPGNVLWCPNLALGGLFKTTSDPQTVGISFRFGWIPLFYPARFPTALDPGVVPLMTREDCQHLLHLPPDVISGVIRRVGTLGHSREHYSVFSEDGGSVSPSSHHMSWSVSDSFQQCMVSGELAVHFL